MTDILPVLRVLGMLIMLFAFAMGVPLAASLYGNDGVWQIYPVCMGFTLMVGGALLLSMRKYKRELQPRHGVMLVSLVWALTGCCGSRPSCRKPRCCCSRSWPGLRSSALFMAGCWPGDRAI